MIRQPFINWNTLNEAKPKKSGVSYLVAIPNTSNKTVTYDFAKYLNKGDSITIDYIKGEHVLSEENKAKLSAEERLLAAIFGAKYEFIAPNDGFYIECHQTFDDFNDVNNEFKDCEYQIIKLDDTTYWSDTPIAPKGYITENDRIARMDADNKNFKLRRDEQRCADMNEAIDRSETTKIAYNSILRHAEMENTPISCDTQEIKIALGGIYNMSTYNVAQSIIVAYQMFDIIKYMTANNITYQDIGEQLCKIIESSDAKTSAEFTKQIDNVLNDIVNKVDASQAAKTMTKKILYDLRKTYVDSEEFPSPYTYRVRAKRKYNNNKSRLAEICIYEECSRKIVFRFARLHRLLQLGAPEIIMMNEFRMLAESLIPLINTKAFLRTDPTEFGEAFGVNTDYTKYEYPENETEADESDEDVIEIDGDYVNPSNDNDEKHGIGYDYPYYAVVKTPTWLMFDGEFAIINNENNEYVADENGNTIVFENIDDAFTFREKHGLK